MWIGGRAHEWAILEVANQYVHACRIDQTLMDLDRYLHISTGKKRRQVEGRTFVIPSNVQHTVVYKVVVSLIILHTRTHVCVYIYIKEN